MSRPDELAARIHEMLPHGAFETAAFHRDGKIFQRVRCRCGRSLPWPAWTGGLPSDVLFRWLADHDDDVFLTLAQLEAKYSATVEKPSSWYADVIKSLTLKDPR